MKTEFSTTPIGFGRKRLVVQKAIKKQINNNLSTVEQQIFWHNISQAVRNIHGKGIYAISDGNAPKHRHSVNLIGEYISKGVSKAIKLTINRKADSAKIQSSFERHAAKTFNA